MIVTEKAIKEMKYVPTGPVIEAIRRRRLSYSDVAERLGWFKGVARNGKPFVGARRGEPVPAANLVDGRLKANFIPYDLAVRICRECGIDPVDVGV